MKRGSKYCKRLAFSRVAVTVALLLKVQIVSVAPLSWRSPNNASFKWDAAVSRLHVSRNAEQEGAEHRQGTALYFVQKVDGTRGWVRFTLAKEASLAFPPKTRSDGEARMLSSTLIAAIVSSKSNTAIVRVASIWGSVENFFIVVECARERARAREGDRYRHRQTRAHARVCVCATLAVDKNDY